MQESARDPEMFAGLDELVETITAASRSQHEQLCAFRQALAEHLVIPCDAFVIGEPVSLIAFGYDGSLRRGLTARCRRADGTEYEVAAADVIISSRISGGRYLAAYRRWLGLEPNSPDTSSRPLHQRKAAATDIDLDSPIELLVLSVKDVAARCRLLGSDRAITLRATQLWKVVPGEIVRVRPRKHLLHGFRGGRHFVLQNYRSCFIQDAVRTGAISQIQPNGELPLENIFCIRPHSANLLHCRSPFHCASSTSINWERIASRRRPAFYIPSGKRANRQVEFDPGQLARLRTNQDSAGLDPFPYLSGCC